METNGIPLCVHVSRRNVTRLLFLCLTSCVCLRLQWTHVSLRIGAVHRKLLFDAEKIVDRLALDDRTCRLSVSHVCNVFQATDQRLWQISIHDGRLDNYENILR